MKFQVKIIHLIIIGLLCAIHMSSCGEDDLATDAELQPYFDVFAAEAKLRGIEVNYVAERIEGLIQDIPNANIQGQCFHNEDKPKKVIIDINYWMNADEFEKEFIIFHELGHCFLDREHLDSSTQDGTCVSIMHSSPQACSFELNGTNREEYLDELFK